MQDGLDRRRQRAYRLLLEMPSGISKTDAVKALYEAGCFDLDPHVERQYDDFVKGFHKACRENDDIQNDMIPLWRLVENGDDTPGKVHYLARFREMDIEQHYQHIAGRVDGVKADVRALYRYMDAMDGRMRTAIQRRFDWLPPRPPEDREDGDDD